MSKRILYIIVGAVVIAALLFLAWFWFFQSPAQTVTSGGTFGTAGNTTPTNQSSQTATNIPSNTSAGQTAANGTVNTQTISIPPTPNTLTTDTGSAASTNVVINPSGAVWLDNSSVLTSNNVGYGNSFNPLSANQLNNANVNGTGPTIMTPGSNASNGSGVSLTGALLAAGVGAAACTANLLGTTALEGVGAAAPADVIITGAAAAAKAAAAIPGTVPTVDAGVHAQLAAIALQNATLAPFTKGTTALAANATFKNQFLDCVTRGIARAAVQQITASIVNWINSGFNGQPSFITNPSQFFTNVADNAAGTYLKSSALAFLCSPFSLQVKIAIAQSYAQQNSANSQQCSLTKAINDITGFMNGNFSAGGWPGMLQFTNMPTNNPYGAFMYGSVGLNSAVSNAVTAQKNDQTLGSGFISLTQGTGCTPGATTATSGSSNTAGKAGVGPITCTGSQVVTPGKVIESQLESTLGNGVQQLQLATSFDQIINALMQQLQIKALQGLSGLSNSGGTAPTVDSASTAQAQSLLQTLQDANILAQNYGGTEQGSISDIQNTQSQLDAAVQCWSDASASSTLSSSMAAQAVLNASSTADLRDSLSPMVTAYNNNITRANAAIAEIQNLETMTLSAASASDVQAISAQLDSDNAQGILIAQTDVTAAQQDRQTLQAQMATLNTTATTQLAQCNAYGQ
jgi:hypothetical protein